MYTLYYVPIPSTITITSTGADHNIWIYKLTTHFIVKFFFQVGNYSAKKLKQILMM